MRVPSSPEFLTKNHKSENQNPYPFLYSSTSPNVITPITEIIIKEFANDCHSFVPVLEFYMNSKIPSYDHLRIITFGMKWCINNEILLVILWYVIVQCLN